MDLLTSDLKTVIAERDERLEDAGLLPRHSARRTSFEVLRDVRRESRERRRAA